MPYGYKEGEVSLGAWVSAQRITKNKGTLSKDRIQRLKALNGWEWDPLQADWEEAYASLQKYVARKGNVRVPVSYKEGEVNLGAWVITQRQLKKNGKLNKDRIQRLGALPGWVWDPLQAAWEEAYASLQKYVARKGNARVPDGYKEGEVKLGAWVATQRLRKKKGTLSEDRIQRLEALQGWTWDPFQTVWEEAYTLLQKYVAREGNAGISKSHKEGEFKLGSWVNSQRSFKKNGRLSKDRIQRLEALYGGVWKVK